MTPEFGNTNFPLIKYAKKNFYLIKKIIKKKIVNSGVVISFRHLTNKHSLTLKGLIADVRNKYIFLNHNLNVIIEYTSEFIFQQSNFHSLIPIRRLYEHNSDNSFKSIYFLT